jgi:hypothetical protein
MPKVLTTASTVLCSIGAPSAHGGTVKTASTARLRVAGSPVLTAAGVAAALVDAASPCTTPPTPGGNKPCTKVTTVNPASVAVKLKVGGVGVLLDTLKGATDGVPPGSLASTANQTKLTAV